MLEPLVKRNLLDLAVVYIIRNAEQGMGTAVVKISKQLPESVKLISSKIRKSLCFQGLQYIFVQSYDSPVR